MRNSGGFLEHSIRIKAEGFEQEKLLTECLRKGIPLKDIHIESDIEMAFTIMEWDYAVFLETVKNRYRITILSEKGYKPAVRKLVRKKSTVVGLILFALLMLYQSTFVSEIRISGYEKFTEAQIRNSLRDAGLYEGCSKRIDINAVKLHIYRELDNITWIGVKYTGNLAEVNIVEGSNTNSSTVPKQVDPLKPCNIVADKEGYLEKTIAREGFPAAQPGTYVKPGDVLINGVVQLRNTAYGTPQAGLTERYVHAAGEVYVKVPYRLSYYQEKYKYIKKPTGKRTIGVRFEIGDLKINTARMYYTYNNSIYSERELFHIIRPIPVNLSIVKIGEVEVTKVERSREEIEKTANMQMRQAMKEKVPENTQILNKSLKFSPGENIIGVAIMLETLEKIGIEKEIVIGNPTDRRTED